MGHGECVGMIVDFVGLGLYDRLNDYFMCEKYKSHTMNTANYSIHEWSVVFLVHVCRINRVFLHHWYRDGTEC